MLDKGPMDESQVNCNGRESGGEEEEQKSLLSTRATGEQEGSDPTPCNFDLRPSKAIKDKNESACSSSAGATALSDIDIFSSKSEIMEDCHEIDDNSRKDNGVSFTVGSDPISLERTYSSNSQDGSVTQSEQVTHSSEEKTSVSNGQPSSSGPLGLDQMQQCQANPTSSELNLSQDSTVNPSYHKTQSLQQLHYLPHSHQHHSLPHAQSFQYMPAPPIQFCPPIPVVPQGQTPASIFQPYPSINVSEQGRPLVVSSPNHPLSPPSLSVSPSQNPSVSPTLNPPISPPLSHYVPQQYVPMAYTSQLGQPYAAMQYPPSSVYQYYHPVPLVHHPQGPISHPTSSIYEQHLATIPSHQLHRPFLVSSPQPNHYPKETSSQANSTIQQDQLTPVITEHSRLSHQGDNGACSVSTCPASQSESDNQSSEEIPNQQEKQQAPSECIPTDIDSQTSIQNQAAAIPEGNQPHPAKPIIGTFPSIVPRACVRLQGPHHLFTVVPVASGDLKPVQEEQSKEEISPTRKNLSIPAKGSKPTVTTVEPTSNTSPLDFTPSKSKPASSHPLKDSPLLKAFISREGEKEYNSCPSTPLSHAKNFSLQKSALAASKAKSPIREDLSLPRRFSKDKRVLPGHHNPYHTVSGIVTQRQPTVRGLSSIQRGFTVGGLGSPFHPRGEYGVGGSSTLRGRRDAFAGSLPRNPYHTVTGMVSNPHPVRDYGIGGGNSYPSFLTVREDRLPRRRYRREFGPGGIPASLANVVMPEEVPMSPNSVKSKRLSWGYTRTLTRNVSGQSLSSCRQMDTTLVEENSDGVASPLLPESEHATVCGGTQVTIDSMGALSIEVGSTDGRAMTVRGALTSPDQLPYLPAVFRHGHLDACKGPLDTYGGGEGRQTWSNKAQFVLACIGYAVGLGNLWRFPYLCYKSGGGAFLIPYFLMLFLCGIPLLLMELAVGQYTRRGPIGALEKLCPIFKGAGVGTVIMSFLLGTYYNVIIAWAIYYLFQSFTSELPWRFCDPAWAVNCFDNYSSNSTPPNGTKSATEEYFNEVVLQKTQGLDDMGSFRLEILLALVGAWILVYFCLWKSVKSSGKVVYVTATLPYLLIGAFLWRALTLPGASMGLRYFFTPKWELLLEGKVWVAAAAQNFNSIGIAFGSLIAFSSYNKFNNNIVLDTWAISLTNSFTSLMSGMIVFSTLGNIALEQSKDIDDVVSEGPGLVFMVYPQALAKMPYGGIWAVLFFFMLLILGLDSQFANVEVIITSLQDGFPKWLKNNLKHHEVLVLIVCLISFFCGLPNVMQGGIYFFTLIDYYAANISLMYLAFFEVISIVWIYGAGRLARNVQDMTSRLPSLYFRGCWYITSPLLILAIWIFSYVDYEPPSYNKGEYEYPDWAIGLGWAIACLSIIPIPIFAVIEVYKAEGANLWEKLKNSFRSQIEDCDCSESSEFNDGVDNSDKHSLDNQVKLVVYNEKQNELNPTSDIHKKNEKETELNGKTQ